jgi:hypothetical protein
MFNVTQQPAPGDRPRAEPQPDSRRQRRLQIVEQYARLIANGRRTMDAAREVGVSTATILAWRDADEELERIVQDALQASPRGGPRWRESGDKRHHGHTSTPADRSWHERFLAELERSGTIKQAATAAGVGRWMPGIHRDKYPDFAAAMAAALRAHERNAQALAERMLAEAEAEQARTRAARLKNDSEQRRRARRADEKVGAAWVKLCRLLRSGTPFTEALAAVNLTQQAVYAYGARHPRRQAGLDDALMAGRDPHISHGTDHSYRKHRCRCPECRVAHAAQR